VARTFTYAALVLRVRPSGESNREAWFLTAEEGILRATVFGGPKSKLRAHAAPFNRGTLWIYHDPVRDSRKVTDFDVRSWRPGIRERYERSAAASAVVETILAAHGGGGDWPAALNLADETLEALAEAEETLCPRILLRFLWNWADILGCRPDPGRCASCACEAPADGVLWYIRREGTLLCPSCAERTPGAGERLPVGPGARRWLEAAESPDLSLFTRYAPDAASFGQAKTLVTEVLAGAFGTRLSGWDGL
jgi:DNA repair protein RecO (recombination protein O)